MLSGLHVTPLTGTAVWAGSTGPGVLTPPAFTESPAYLSLFLGLHPQGNKYWVILDSTIDQTMANTICGFIISSGANLDEIFQTFKAWVTLAGKQISGIRNHVSSHSKKKRKKKLPY